jgi:hypothetical protein
MELRILDQSFRAEPLNQERMLTLFEGETIPFQFRDGASTREVKGKIIRGSYPQSEGSGKTGSPIIELDGRYVFALPGTPSFPKLPEGASIKSELVWTIAVDKPAELDAELVFVTEGLTWSADYNAVVAENGDLSQLVGWITIKNETTRTFENAKVKVVAGQVNRVTPAQYEATTERVITTASYLPTGENESPIVQRSNFR